MGGASGSAIERGKWSTPGAMRNFYAGEATVIAGASIADKSSFPAGYMFPYTWVAAPKAGGLASRNKANGTGTAASNLLMGVALSGTITCAATISGDLLLTVPVSGTSLGVGGVTGDLVGIAPLSGTVNGLATVTGDIGAIANLSGTAAGVGSLSVSVGAFPVSLSGSVIVSYEATVTAAEMTAIITETLATKAELEDAFTEIKGATWSSVTDTLENIFDNGGGGGGGASAEDIRIEMDANSTKLAYLDAAITSRGSAIVANGTAIYTTAAWNRLIILNNAMPITFGSASADGTSTTIRFQNTFSSVDGFYVGSIVQQQSQVRVVIGYVGSTKTATVDRPWTSIPLTGYSYYVQQGAYLGIDTSASLPRVTSVGSLEANALNNISIAAEAGRPTTFRGQLVWLYSRFANKLVKTNDELLESYAADDATVLTEQILSGTGLDQTIGKANTP
jgi:hypothetical protein